MPTTNRDLQAANGVSTITDVELTDGTNVASINSDGQLHVVQMGKLDSGNSTSANLAGGATFTGESIDTSDFSAVTIVISSDVASATNGLNVQYSIDSSDWHTGELYTITAGASKFFTPTLQSKYMRVVYTNGATPTSDFHIHTMLRKQPIKWSSHNIEDAIVDQDDAELIKAVITGKRADGVYDNVSLTNGGNMKVSVEEHEPTGMRIYTTETALGSVTGHYVVNKFGAAPDGIQATPTDVWDRADATPTQQIWVAPTQARIHAIASSSGSDAAGGTGAASVIVYGLVDWDTAEVNETVTLTGVTPVNTVNSYVIIHRMRCVAQATTTTAGVNAGTITATAATDGTVTAAILAGNGQTEMAIYGVPSTQKALLYRWTAQIDRTVAVNTTVDFRLRVNENPDVQLLGFIRKDDISLQTGGTTVHCHAYKFPKVFTGPCIIKVQGTASAADVDAESEFDLELVDI